MIKPSLDTLAVFGGKKIFAAPKSTSNLLQPDIEKYLMYSRAFFEQRHYTNNGPNVRKLEQRLCEFHETKFCVTFSTGFWGLALAIRTLALAGRDEIVMPSLTYRRMPDIAAWVKLKPRFCEVDPQTLAQTSETVLPCLNENTALILAAHPIVNCCDSADLVKLAHEKGIPIVFDSVESVYESVEEGRVGGFGDAECFSLHACKLLNGFGGGYLTTNDEALAARLSALRSFGFSGLDNVKFPYGLNAKLNEMHACLTLASLDDVEEQIVRNRERYYAYRSGLSKIPGIRLLEFDERYRTGYKNIVVELTSDWPLSRALTIQVLNAENVLARPHYHPALHRKAMDFPFIPADLPLTDKLAEIFLNLPCGHLVSIEDIHSIVGLLAYMAANADAIAARANSLEKK